MLDRLRRFYRKELMTPTWLSIFINPFYFQRRGVAEGIRRNAHFMRGVMLDFGCGSKPFQEFFRVHQYVGVDTPRSGHDHTGESIDVIYDGKTLPFPDRHFDSILSTEVFEHIFEPDDIVGELHRVLKKGGYMLVSTPFVWEEHETPYDFARYSTFGIRHMLEKRGFEIIKLEKSTTTVETIIQAWNTYVYQYVFPKNKYIKIALTIPFILPMNILGILLSKILPKNFGLYQTNIVVVRKM